MKKANKCVKLVVDTNVWISFLIGKHLDKLHYYIAEETVCIISCEEQVQELLAVFQKPKIQKLFSKHQVEEFFDLFLEAADIIPIKTKVELCRDAKDNYLLSLAIDSKADFMITGDYDLLVLETVEHTKILNFINFATVFKKQGS
jgi:putative PIN family toxin of toxin-antitoxin system